MHRRRRQIIQTLLFLILIILAGTTGYHFFEGWPFFDALYMTVITLATVGFSEIHPLSDLGRVFTIFLIMGGMGVILYGISEVTAFVVEGEMTGLLRRRRMDLAIEKLANHYILCGWGSIGYHILEELTRTQRQCVVVESNPEKVKRLLEMKFLVIQGDGTQDEVLERSGIRRAAGLIAALHSDKDNLFVVITARGMNPHLRIISKIEDINGRDKFLRSGANGVVSANLIGGLRMASEMIRPDAVSFLDTMLRDSSALRVEDIRIGDSCPFNGKEILSIDALARSGVLLVSLKRGSTSHFNPSPSMVLQANDSLVLIGDPKQVQQARAALDTKT